MDEAVREAFEQLIEKWREEPGCGYCGAVGNCHPACPTRVCGECGGLGMVLDLEELIGVDIGGNPVYAGKACPRGCPIP